MGGACSTPHIDTNEPPLEILILSDGCSPDAALVEFLTQPGWLSSSALLQRRLPPRQPHKLPPPITVTTQNPLSRKRSSRSEAAGSNGGGSTVHPAPQSPSATSVSSSPATSLSVTTSASHSPPSSTSLLSSSPSSSPTSASLVPPLLYFLCDTHPICVRFHTCPDYSTLTKRRASTLAKQARPHATSHSRRPSASTHLSQPIQSTSPLDGAIVFLSTRDALVAGSVLIAGIRPMLKRRLRDKAAVSGGDGNRPAVGRVGAEGNMLPFVVVGVEEGEGREEEAKTAAEESSHQRKSSSGRIQVHPRLTSDCDTTKKESDSATSLSPHSADSAPLPTVVASPSTSPHKDRKGLAKPRASLSDSTEGRASSSVVERPNSSSSAVTQRKLGVDEGKGLAVDSGAVGYAAVDVKTGKAMDVALKQLVLAIRKDRQLRGHKTGT